MGASLSRRNEVWAMVGMATGFILASIFTYASVSRDDPRVMQEIRSALSVIKQLQTDGREAGDPGDVKELGVGCYSISQQVDDELKHARLSQQLRYNMNMNSTHMLRKVDLFDKLGFTKTNNPRRATLYSCNTRCRQVSRVKEGRMYVNKVNGTKYFADSKAEQARLSQLFGLQYGCDMFKTLMPPLWDLSDEKECKDFFRTAASPQQKDTWWIKKPSNLGAAKGITIHSGLDGELLYYQNCNLSSELPEVIQEYVHDTYLIEDRKFDIRSFMLVASTRPFIVFHYEGFLRRSLKPYSDEEMDPALHLTNGHVQREVEDFVPEDHVWSMRDLADYISQVGHDACQSTDDCYDHIERQIKEIEKFLFLQAKDRVVRYSGSFQLLGTDFLVMEDLRIQLIEANMTPGMHNSSTVLLETKYTEIVESYHKLIFELMENDHDTLKYAPGKVHEGWEVLYNEAYEQCYGEDSYDPCVALSHGLGSGEIENNPA